MRKITVRLLALLSTFLVGVFSFYFTTSENRQVDVVEAVYPTSQQISENETKLPERAEPREIKPCTDEDQFKFRPEWKSRGKVISKGILNHRIVCGILPEYPKNLKNKISGVVTVWVTLNESGEVVSASAHKGNRSFHQAAVHAARHTRFPPTLLGGQSYWAYGVLVYEFDASGQVRFTDSIPVKL
jgi:TonB family protein